MIPKLDHSLPAGTYQLREKLPLEGYQALPGNIEFSVSKTGEVSLLPSMASAEWASLTGSADSDGTLVYILTVKNCFDAPLTLKKVDENGADLPGAKFRLCKYETSWEVVSDYSDDITLDNTGHILSVKNIPGTSLPDTGGTGTKLFSIIGIILTVFAGAVLRRRRRMGY